MTPDNEKLYDLSYLKENISNDEDVIRELIMIFLENTPQDLKNLNRAYNENNLEQVALTAHKMKSSLDVLKIKPLHDVIRRIDKPFKAEEFKDELPEIINKINNVIETVIGQLQDDFSA